MGERTRLSPTARPMPYPHRDAQRARVGLTQRRLAIAAIVQSLHTVGDECVPAAESMGPTMAAVSQTHSVRYRNAAQCTILQGDGEAPRCNNVDDIVGGHPVDSTGRRKPSPGREARGASVDHPQDEVQSGNPRYFVGEDVNGHASGLTLWLSAERSSLPQPHATRPPTIGLLHLLTRSLVLLRWVNWHERAPLSARDRWRVSCGQPAPPTLCGWAVSRQLLP